MDRATSIELAAGPGQSPELLDTDQYVIVELLDAPYAIPLGTVVEVEQIPPVAPVPRTRPWVRGVVNLRGSVLTLVDLSRLLGLGDWSQSASSRMLVIDREDPVALAVDRLRGMRRLSDRLDNAIVDHLPGDVGRYCLGLYREEGEYIAALDIPTLLQEVEGKRAGSSATDAAPAFESRFGTDGGRL